LKGYDEPEILPYSTRRNCLIGADAGHSAAPPDIVFYFDDFADQFNPIADASQRSREVQRINDRECRDICFSTERRFGRFRCRNVSASEKILQCGDGRTHVSISVDQDGQIQRLDEAQARFRLGSGSGTSPSSNQDILKKYVQTKTPSTAAQPQHRPSAYKPSAPSHSTPGFLSQILGWVWLAGIIALLFFLARH
jgi:hypothetical protein